MVTCVVLLLFPVRRAVHVSPEPVGVDVDCDVGVDGGDDVCCCSCSLRSMLFDGVIVCVLWCV